MSGNVEEELADFFNVKSNQMELDKPVPFDCFIYLKINEKVIHWLRKDDIFTVERAEKLKALGMSELLVPRYHVQALVRYLRIKFAAEGTKAFVSLNLRPEEKSSLAPAKLTNPKSRVDVDFLNAVIKSVQEVFQDQFQTPIKARPPAKRSQKNASSLRIDVASFIALTSQTIRGTIGLCFPEDTYLFMLNKATESNYQTLGPGYYTGCGEFMFAIYEYARPKLIDLGYNIDRAVPILAVGKSLSVPHIIPDNGFSIVFDSAGGPFQFEVGIKTGG